jgi:hypothetical protein
MTDQEHSHPVLRRRAVEKKPSPSKEIVPVSPPADKLKPALGTPHIGMDVPVANPTILADIASQARDIEGYFKHKAILFIGAECYDAPTITILEGLASLGFTIYTLHKSNVNSWFCDEVIESTTGLKFDFILSNLQWGVRWSHYGRYRLHSYPKVLIDGCDNHGDLTWRQKIERVRDSWKARPSQDITKQELQPYQWGEDESRYTPDLIFASQLFPGYNAIYLPFGIQSWFITMAEEAQKASPDRDLHFTYLSGAGSARKRVNKWLQDSPLPNQRLVRDVRGQAAIPTDIASFIARDGTDPGIHSWFRWVHYQGYYNLLSRSHALVYSNVWDGKHWWDSKRPWEALASGCLLMTEKPTIDMSEYPITALSPFTVFSSQQELIDKAYWLFGRPSHLDRMRVESTALAYRYFTPEPLARRFLLYVRDVLLHARERPL